MAAANLKVVSAYQAGYVAGMYGESHMVCRRYPFSLEFDAWMAGWKSAQAAA